MKHMRLNKTKTFDLFIVVIMVALWVWGFFLAQGFWNTVLALFPPIAWYFVIEYLIKDTHLLMLLNL